MLVNICIEKVKKKELGSSPSQIEVSPQGQALAEKQAECQMHE